MGLPKTSAPPEGRIKKLSYTHEAMVDLIVAHPGISQGELAAAFGYTPPWISTVLASDAFQQQLAARRNEIVDPALKATMEERFRALTIQSMNVLMGKLAQPNVSDTLALKAAELGAKSLGIGGHGHPTPTAPAEDRLEKLAERLVALQSGVRERVIEGRIVEIPDEDTP